MIVGDGNLWAWLDSVLCNGAVGVQQKFVENPIRNIYIFKKTSIPAFSLIENINNEQLIYGSYRVQQLMKSPHCPPCLYSSFPLPASELNPFACTLLQPRWANANMTGFWGGTIIHFGRALKRQVLTFQVVKRCCCAEAVFKDAAVKMIFEHFNALVLGGV